jgi:hypothetical protein
MGTTTAFFQSEGTVPVSQIFWNHMRLEILASFPVCCKNSARIWSSPRRFSVFQRLCCFLEFEITNWRIKYIFSCYGFCTSIFLFVWYAPSTVFDSPLAYVPFFCAHEKVHANVLAIPLSLVITSLFSCIGTFYCRGYCFEFLLGICRFSGCLSGNWYRI